MASSTGAPWNLPTPDAPEQPNAPAQLADLADSIHAALGRAYPCVSGARPSPQEGLFIFETDTDTLLFSPDGTNWRTITQFPTVAGTGSTEDATVLTAATGFTVGTQRFYKAGGMVHCTVTVTRTGTTLAAGSNGNITNVAMATIAAGWRPPLGNWGNIVGGTLSGNMMVGYVSEAGTFAVSALLPSIDWTSGSTQSWTGSWPLGDG